MNSPWHKNGCLLKWPYPLSYDQEREVECDVLVVGGGIAGCWAAIAAARRGLSVALVEKSDVVRSGAGGPGCDHWCDVPANPLSNVDPDEWARHLAELPYSNGIGVQIQCRESYDTLLELEKMGGKIRDSEDEYVGAKGRDEKTKLMVSPRFGRIHSYLWLDQEEMRRRFVSNPDGKPNNVVLRVWGSTFKPALKRECNRLGVRVYNRVMITSLLTENGEPGKRVVGATGVHTRTGEFFVFKAKATILATGGGSWSIWLFNTELAGYNSFLPRTIASDGIAMAWRAGAELTLMEETRPLTLGSGFKHTWYGGAGDASYENVELVDANGRKVPWPTQGWRDYGAMRPKPEQIRALKEAIMRGEFSLPFFGDFPGMPEVERKVTWNLMLREESTSRIIVDSYSKAGFDPARHLLMSFIFLEGESPPQWQAPGRGGVIVDWDLRSTVEGLYVAGGLIFSHGDHSFAASTGRYAGRKAASYAAQVDYGNISREQVKKEKERIYAHLAQKEGIDWKELNAGIARVMQYFCSEYKTETLLKMGLDSLCEIEEEFVPRLYAPDPHKLMRCLEDLNILTHAKIILQASLARKSSSKYLNFYRIDYPQIDPPEWTKFITLKLEDREVVYGERAIDYWGDMKANYEAHNRDYKGPEI
ncbi:MAG: FAD-dependent oxidoreductase [Candidatus Bathyarchaeia archaeon]